jgi:DNA polymerase-3 subunit epsilon
VRHTWPRFSRRGYGLKNIAAWLGIPFDHHNAVEDARAAGEVVVRALGEKGVELAELLKMSKKSLGRFADKNVTRTGDPNGPLAGEVIVFTGSFSISRVEAADRAAAAGCGVAASVNSHTTILVVGKPSGAGKAPAGKGAKLRRAETLVADGFPVRILSEQEFLDLIEQAFD